MQPLIQYCQRCQKSHPPGAHSATMPKPKPSLMPKALSTKPAGDGVGILMAGVPTLHPEPGPGVTTKVTSVKKLPRVKKKPAKKGAKSGKRQKPCVPPKKTRADTKTTAVRQGQAEVAPAKMSRAQLEAYVAADLERKAAARTAKAKAQAKWRKTLK